MTKSKHTKRALLASIFSILLCLSMLIGSTFAWFTDSAVSGKNKIVAGNLDVELEYTTTPDIGTSWKPVEENTNLFLPTEGANATKWEPGHVEVVNLKVANLGTLALQYKLGINIVDETPGTNVYGDTFKLSDYIRFAVIDGEKDFGAGDAGRKAAISAAEASSVKLSEIVKKNGTRCIRQTPRARNPKALSPWLFICPQTSTTWPTTRLEPRLPRSTWA